MRPLLSLSLVFLAALLLLPASAGAARDLEVSIMDDQLLLGAPQERVDAAMGAFHLLGVDRLRVSAFWADHAPRPTSRRRPRFVANDGFSPAYRWERLDRVVLTAARSNLKVMISISTPAPYWATASPRRRNGVLRPKPEEFALFAQAVAHRYGQVVDHFGVLNEPNQGAWLQPQSDRGGLVSPHLYRELVQAAYPAIKAAAPSSLALVGELAPSGRSDRGATRPVRPLEFLRAMGCRNRRFRRVRSGRCRGFRPVPADAIGHHPYSVFSAPHARSRNRDDAAMGDTRRLLRTLDRLVRGRAIDPSGSSRLDVYYTEFGYQTDPPDPFSGIPLSRQDRWLQDAAYFAWRMPRIRGLNQFRLTDGAIDRRRGADAFREFQSGLMFDPRRPKPSLSSFPDPFAASTTRPRRGRSLRLWGQVRPGVAHEVSLERRTGRRGAFRELDRLATDERGYFTRRVPATRATWRFRWSGGTSRAIAITPR